MQFCELGCPMWHSLIEPRHSLTVLFLTKHVYYFVAHACLIAAPSELAASKHLVARVFAFRF